MSEYTITIDNQSGRDQRYYIYADAPTIDNDQVKIRKCVLKSSVAREGISEITLKTTPYVVDVDEYDNRVSINSWKRIEGGSIDIAIRERGVTKGLGFQTSGSDDVHAVAVFDAYPDDRFTVTPNMTFHLCRGEVMKGQIIGSREEWGGDTITSSCRVTWRQ